MQINADLFKKVQLLEDLGADLGVQLDHRHRLTPSELADAAQNLQIQADMMARSISGTRDLSSLEEIQFSVDPDFDVSDLFQSFSSFTSRYQIYKEVHAAYFKDFNARNNKPNVVLRPWSVNVGEGIDEGGLSRQFSNDLFSKLKRLKVDGVVHLFEVDSRVETSVQQATLPTRDSRRAVRDILSDETLSPHEKHKKIQALTVARNPDAAVAVHRKENVNIVPRHDDILEQDIRSKQLEVGTALTKCHLYYRAVGRIFAHMILSPPKSEDRDEHARRLVISDHALPCLYRNCK